MFQSNLTNQKFGSEGEIMTFVPFSLSLQLFPQNPGKRFENVRELQQAAKYIYDGIIANTSIHIAQPGGGQAYSAERYSSHVDGLAVKPAFGSFPAQATVTGFYEVSRENNQPVAEVPVVHCGESMSGIMGNVPAVQNPKTFIDTEVKALKAALIAAIDAAIPPNVVYSVYKLDYSGVLYGFGGFHFPR